MRRPAFPIVLGLCTLVSVLPLWVGRHLPSVDVPQHLFLIHVLGRLGDPSLPYAQLYEARPGLTYLTFYYTVRALGAVVGVEVALRLWLTLVLGAIPCALAVLLKAFGRSPWLALLACPLLFTDNFYWGLISFQSSLALTLLVLAFFVRALEVPVRTRASATALGGLGLSLALLQLTHAAGMIFPGVALPLLLVTTPSDRTRRARALLALVPGVALFLGWLLGSVGRNRQFGEGPWKASGPVWDPANFDFAPLRQRLEQLLGLLANGFWSWADRPFLWGLAALGLVAVALTLARVVPDLRLRPARVVPDLRLRLAGPAWVVRARPALLFAVALAYYLFLPTDVRGYMYMIHPRYAQLAALLAIPLLALPAGRSAKPWVAAAALLALYAGLNHALLFRRFDAEAEAFEAVAARIEPRARIMHLVVDWSSREATHAVYLHYAALAALRSDGVPSFSLATDPSFPVGYRPGAQPPASPWEWRPLEFDWDSAGRWYDYYLVRSATPGEALFGPHRDEVERVVTRDRWQLFRRRDGSAPPPGPDGD